MRRLTSVWTTAVVLALCAQVAAGQKPTVDMTGAWTVTITRSDGTVSGLAILSQDGSKITGMIGPGETDMMPAEGTVDGNKVTPRVVVDLRLEKPLLAHRVQQDLLETTQGLAFKGPPQPQFRPVCAEPLAEFVPSGSRQVELLRADDLNAGNDVMSLDGYAMNPTQVTILLATEHDRPGQEHASGHTKHS